MAGVAKASFWENFQRDLGSWEDVVGEIVLTERQAKIYQERLGIRPKAKMVRPFDPLEDDEELPSNMTRTFRSDIRKWQFRKNSNGEWIVPIYEETSFVENILTPSESWQKIEWFNNELNTCIEFTEISKGRRRQYPHRLKLIGDQVRPCFSYIGASYERADQPIGWVEKCSSMGHIASFLMTALGFTYEHMRPGYS